MAGKGRTSRFDDGSPVIGVVGMRNIESRLPVDDMPFGGSQREAFRLASRQFSESDIAQRCKLAGAEYEDSEVRLPFLGRRISLRLPTMEFSYEDEGNDVPLVKRILILHYLNSTDGSDPSGEPVAFRSLPGGQVYHPIFEKRASERLARRFADDACGLVRAAEALGGTMVSVGDAGVIVPGFPKVPITCLIWEADDEFPASGSVLLDSRITHHLSIEDVVVVAQEAVTEIILRARR